MELHGSRDETEHGPRRFKYREILAWAELARVRLTPLEVEWLRALDDAYLEHERVKAMPATPQNIAVAAALAPDDEDDDDDDEDDDGDSSPA